MLPEDLMREVRLLEIRAKRRVSDLFAGDYHSAFRGQGMEFAEVRDYSPGDDVRTIDWNVTARAGRPFVKRFVEERENTVVLAVDLSASTAFGSRTRTKARLIAEVSAILAMVARRNNDRVALARFADRFDLYLPPAKSREHVLRVIRGVLDTPPSGRGTALDETVASLTQLLKRRSIVFLVSDFLDGIGDDTARLIRLLGRRHELSLIRVQDPLETSPPPWSRLRVIDPESGRSTMLGFGSARRRRRIETRAHARDMQLRHAALAAGADCIELSTPGRYIDELAAAFRRRERRR